MTSPTGPAWLCPGTRLRLRVLPDLAFTALGPVYAPGGHAWKLESEEGDEYTLLEEDVLSRFEPVDENAQNALRAMQTAPDEQ